MTLCRFRSRLAWPRIAAPERRESIQEGGDPSGRPIVSAPRNAAIASGAFPLLGVNVLIAMKPTDFRNYAEPGIMRSRRPAPFDGGSVTPACLRARATMYEIEEDVVNGR